MATSVPVIAQTAVTGMLVPAAADAKEDVPELKLTDSLPTIPVNVPVIVAAVELSNVLVVTAASGIVNSLAVMFALALGCVIE